MNTSRKFWRTSFFVVLLAAVCGSLAFPATYAPVSAAPQMQAGTADLTLTMTVNNATPNMDDPVIFTITVTNAGPDVATNVSVQDILPAGLTYVSDSGGGTYDSTTGVWVVGTVGIGALNNVSLIIRTNATTTGTLTNTAQILSSDQTDPTPNLPVSVNVTPASADVSLTMAVDNPAPSIGDVVTFTITATNVGSIGNATGVRVTDILPAGLSFVSYTSTPNGTYTASTGNWSVGSLPMAGPNSTKILTLVTQVTTTGPKVNTASVTQSDQLDPDTSNNSVSITLNAPTADLSLTMIASTTTPNRAEDVVFTITATNTGPSNATGVTVRVPLPAGLTLQGPAPAGYNAVNGNWSIGSLPAGVGSTVTLTLTARATTVGSKNVVAEVWSSNQFDPDSTPGNGITEDDLARVTVTPRAADLSLSKTVSGPVSTNGSTVQFDITVDNDGPDTATGVTVQDVLPTGYQYQTHVVTAGAYTPGTGVWDIGSLVNNATARLTITAIVQTGNKTNWAEVITSDQLDTDSTPGNTSTTEDDDDVAPKMDLSLTKSRNRNVIVSGEIVTFTLSLENEGASEATGVTVRDVLPAGLTYVSDNGGGAYVPATGIWTVGSVPRNAIRTLQIRARGTALGIRTNSAEVWTADQTDVDSIPQNNSTTEDDDARINVNVSYPKLTVLINEIAWYGTAASTSDEWIELYNPGSTPIDLTGWVLQGADGSPSIQLSGSIGVGAVDGYYLLERTDDNTVIDADADLIFTGDLENSSETLQLRDPSGNIIDTANANGGVWPAGTYSFNSMERSGVIPDTDTAWISNTRTNTWTKHDGRTPSSTSTLIRGTPGYANWAFTVTATPLPPSTPTRTKTPTRTPTQAPPPPLVAINEFVPRPGHDWNNDGAVNVQDEYVEIINHGTINVNLSGYSLDDEANLGSEPYRLPSVTLEPGGRVVFYGSETGLLLSDGGDGVRLLKPNGQLMDAFNYTVARYADQSYCRLPDNGGLDDWNNDCYPTPGLQNSLSGDFTPPSVDGDAALLCPIADTLPEDFVFAECSPFGNNIWRRAFWDDEGWYGEKVIPGDDRRWDVFAD